MLVKEGKFFLIQLQKNQYAYEQLLYHSVWRQLAQRFYQKQLGQYELSCPHNTEVLSVPKIPELKLS